MRLTPVAWPALAIALAGCSALNPLGGTSSYACPLPDGKKCQNLTTTYQEPLRPATAGGAPTPAPTSMPQAAVPVAVALTPPQIGEPLRTAPRTLRVWIAPWEDSEGDLHDAHHVYLSLDAGRWRLAHARSALMERFAPLPVPVRAGTTPAAATAAPAPLSSGADPAALAEVAAPIGEAKPGAQ